MDFELEIETFESNGYIFESTTFENRNYIRLKNTDLWLPVKSTEQFKNTKLNFFRKIWLKWKL